MQRQHSIFWHCSSIRRGLSHWSKHAPWTTVCVAQGGPFHRPLLFANNSSTERPTMEFLHILLDPEVIFSSQAVFFNASTKDFTSLAEREAVVILES